MDDHRFDALARALGGASTRRSTLAALAGLLAGTSALETGAKKKRRKRCDPKCPPGQSCHRGACRCEGGGTVCGPFCCLAGQRCESGTCVEPPEPGQCVAFGLPCKGVGVPCCDGLVCGSGQSGKQDVACYRPAGAACDTTAECVYDSDCIQGTCVARLEPTPEPCRGSVPVTGDPKADGEALRALAEDPDGPDTITLCAGVYQAAQEIRITRDLAIEAAANAGGEVMLDGGWSGGAATDGHRVIRVADAAVSLTGIVVRRGYVGAQEPEQGGCVLARSTSDAVAAALTLTRVTVTGCKAVGNGGGIAVSAISPNNRATLAVHDSEVSDCEADGLGGGLDFFYASVTMDGTTKIARNTATVTAGGFSARLSIVTVGGQARVTGNTAAENAGGFSASSSSVTLGGTARVTGNSAGADGAGFYNSNSTITCDGPGAKVCANPTSQSAGCLGPVASGCSTIQLCSANCP